MTLSHYVNKSLLLGLHSCLGGDWRRLGSGQAYPRWGSRLRSAIGTIRR